MINNFTPRELDIVKLIAKGIQHKNIATSLSMSIHTVDTHLNSIHKKTNTHTMAELVLLASRLYAPGTPVISIKSFPPHSHN